MEGTETGEFHNREYFSQSHQQHEHSTQRQILEQQQQQQQQQQYALEQEAAVATQAREQANLEVLAAELMTLLIEISADQHAIVAIQERKRREREELCRSVSSDEQEDSHHLHEEEINGRLQDFRRN
jgi:hypothetical protein